jgi:hypothetical protein
MNAKKGIESKVYRLSNSKMTTQSSAEHQKQQISGKMTTQSSAEHQKQQISGKMTTHPSAEHQKQQISGKMTTLPSAEHEKQQISGKMTTQKMNAKKGIESRHTARAGTNECQIGTAFKGQVIHGHE